MSFSQVTAARFYEQADRMTVSYRGRTIVSIEPILDGRKYYRLLFDLGDTVLVASSQLLQRVALLADLYDTTNQLRTRGAALRYENGVIVVNGKEARSCVAAANGFIELQLTGGECIRITDLAYHSLISE